MFGFVYFVLLNCDTEISTVKLMENCKGPDSELEKGIPIPENSAEEMEEVLKGTAQVPGKGEWQTKFLW